MSSSLRPHGLQPASLLCPWNSPGKNIEVGCHYLLQVVKNPPANAGDLRDEGSIPGSGRSPGGEYGNPLQYSCLGNSMDRGDWWAMVHSVAKSLKRLSMHNAELWKDYGLWNQTWVHVSCMPSHFSRVQLFATLWTIACQAPLSMACSRQDYWRTVPFSRGSSRPRDQTWVSSIAGTREAQTLRTRAQKDKYCVIPLLRGT